MYMCGCKGLCFLPVRLCMAAFEIKLLLQIYLGVMIVDRIIVYLLVLSALPFEILLLT